MVNENQTTTLSAALGVLALRLTNASAARIEHLIIKF